MPVWGMKYIQIFFDTILPMQLVNTNLPLIAKNHKIDYVIYTSKSDFRTIRDSLRNTTLPELASIEIKTLNKRLLSNTYKAYGKSHNKELKKSAGKNQCVYFLNADIALSNRFFPNSLAKIKEGFNVVQVVCPRANKESISEILSSKFKKTNGTISVSAKSLMQLWLKNIHPLMSYHLLPQKEGSKFHPSSLMWRVNESKAVYVRAFHLHPILIYPKKRRIRKFGHTIDDGWVYEEFKSKEIYIEERNRHFFSIELSGSETFYEAACQYGNSSSISRYIGSLNASTFPNLASEVIIGDASKESTLDAKATSADLINKMLIEFVAFTNEKQKRKIPPVVLRLYLRTALYVRGLRTYIPQHFYLWLKKVHHRNLRVIFGIEVQKIDSITSD